MMRHVIAFRWVIALRAVSAMVAFQDEAHPDHDRFGLLPATL